MPTRSDGVRVNQSELANLYGVSTVTIRTWKKRGCPVADEGGRGRAEVYNTADVAKWREGQAALAISGNLDAMDEQEGRRRKLVAESALAELTLDERRGLVVEVGVLMEEIGRGLDACRTRLLSIGANVAPILAMESDAAACKATVDDAVNEALHELSSPAFEFPAGAEGDGSGSDEVDVEGAVQSASEAKPKRVGRRKQGAVA